MGLFSRNHFWTGFGHKQHLFKCHFAIYATVWARPLVETLIQDCDVQILNAMSKSEYRVVSTTPFADTHNISKKVRELLQEWTMRMATAHGEARREIPPMDQHA